MTETTNQTEAMLTLPLEKFPYLEVQKKSVKTLKELIELLNKRIKLINKKTGEASDYEVNEDKINVIKTEIELAKLHAQVIQKENSIKEYTKNITEYIAEMETKWQEVMQRAEKKAKNDKTLADMLEKSKGTDYDKNYEHKIGHYIQVKSYLYPQKTTK